MQDSYTARLCKRCDRWIDCRQIEGADFLHVEAFHPELIETVTDSCRAFPFMSWNDEPVQAHAWDEPL